MSVESYVCIEDFLPHLLLLYLLFRMRRVENLVFWGCKFLRTASWLVSPSLVDSHDVF